MQFAVIIYGSFDSFSFHFVIECRKCNDLVEFLWFFPFFFSVYVEVFFVSADPSVKFFIYFLVGVISVYNGGIPI